MKDSINLRCECGRAIVIVDLISLRSEVSRLKGLVEVAERFVASENGWGVSERYQQLKEALAEYKK